MGSDSGDETKIVATVTKGKVMEKTSKEEVLASTNTENNSNNASNEKNIIDLFHIKVISKHAKIDTLFDSGSQAKFNFYRLGQEVESGNYASS